ncbi:MAG: hypothetical protein KC910_13675 [Candidatus Eremiobacteraeota bacterium]|nr:hypothetical protein [Candidatus Eremiobacteraeota bacterium]
MRPLRLLLLGLLFWSNPAWAGRNPTFEPGQAAGPARLGESPQAVVNSWGQPRRRVAPAAKGEIPAVYFEYPEQGLWLLVRAGKIVRIGLESGSWQGPQGLRLWQSESEAVRVLGAVRPRQAGDDKSHYFLDYPDKGISLLILAGSRQIAAIHLYRPGEEAGAEGRT